MVPISSASPILPVILAVMVVTLQIIRIEGNDYIEDCADGCEKFRPWAASKDDNDGPFELNCWKAPPEIEIHCESWQTNCNISLCGPKNNGRDQCSDMCERFREWAAPNHDKDGPFEVKCWEAPSERSCEAWKSYCGKKSCGPKNSKGNNNDQCEEPCDIFRKWANRDPNKNGPYTLECGHAPYEKQESCKYWKTICSECGPKKIIRDSNYDVIIVISVIILFLVSCGLATGACAWSTNRNYRRYKNWQNQPDGQDGDPPPGDGGVSDKNQNDSVTVGGDPAAALGPGHTPASKGP